MTAAAWYAAGGAGERLVTGDVEANQMHETFPHTADLGLRVRATDLQTLLAEAGQALFSALVANLDTVQPVELVEYHVAGDDYDYLLFDWLNELLYGFQKERIVFSRFDVEVDDSGLTARCLGERLDTERHVLDHDIKAITYHGLQVVERDGCWQAEVIVDI
jgi:SHS2 domain-containing protein